MTIENIDIVLDNQDLTILKSTDWNELINKPIYKDLPIYTASTEKIVKNVIRLIIENPNDLFLGLYKSKNHSQYWSIVPLLKYKSNLQRVQIEHLTCSHCGWIGDTANPTEASLYFGLNEELKLLKNATKLNQVGCPNCGEHLPRFAIWAKSK